jgi:hypothetical protein
LFRGKGQVFRPKNSDHVTSDEIRSFVRSRVRINISENVFFLKQKVASGTQTMFSLKHFMAFVSLETDVLSLFYCL